jgi:hypothetical protein
MKQKKTHKKIQVAAPVNIPNAELLYNKFYPFRFDATIAIILSLISILSGIFFLVQAKSANGYFCFPLDDSWIHLTFARNLVDFGSFSYYKNQLATSGSTSPAYTFLLTGLYFFSKNEFIISYILGIGFLSLSVFFTFRLQKLHFSSAPWLAVFSALLVALQPGLNLISVSGMETTMFISLIAISLYNYKKMNKTALGISLGLLLWCRPDGLILWVAIIADYIIAQKLGELKRKKAGNSISFNELYQPFIIAGGIALIYFIFNYSLSGSLLPNTFRSKLATYQHNSRSEFLTDDVFKYFSSNEYLILFIPFILSSVIIIRDLFKKKHNEFSVYLIFIVGFITIYWWLLPFSSSFGRYLMPVIPSFIILSVYGAKSFLEFLSVKIKSINNVNIIGIAYFAATLGFSWYYLMINSDLYSDTCKYYNVRHVYVGKWINNNTPVNSVIATHDIGAIEFYGNRKLIDMVGLVSPEIIDQMKDGFIAFLNKYLIEKKPDYVIVLKNWFEIVNDNPVLVPVNEPEIMDVYKFRPNKTHILEGEVQPLLQRAVQYLNMNDKPNAERAIIKALQADPISSKTNFFLGYFYLSSGDKMRGEQYIAKALSIFPDFADANYFMARLQFEKNNYSLSKVYLDKCLSVNPGYKDELDLMEKLKIKL